MACATSFHSFSSSPFPHGTRRQCNSTPSYVTFPRSLPSISASYATINERTYSTTSPSTLSKTSSLYKILGVQDGATCKEIKAAYRSLARTLHPDVATVTSSADDFIRVREAYTTLSDPIKRADYDKMLLFRRTRLAGYSTSFSNSEAASVSGTTRFSGYARRTWETDQCW